MTGRVAIVTGAASGIGRQTAVDLAAAGWHVALLDRDEGGLAAAAKQIGDAATTYAGDLTEPAHVRATIEAVVQKHGRLDGLVNSHGVTVVDDNRVADVPDDLFGRILDINLTSMFYLCKYALPHLVATPGSSIVNLASVAALGAFGGPAYSASKAGIVALTRVIAREYAGSVRCNAVAPGATDTPMFAVTRQKRGTDEYTPAPGTIPRMADTTEIAAVVEFLLSDRASYVTGSTYAADGGMSMH